MSKKPLVSVIIPTYNRPKYLKRCLDSVLNQTYENIEIIVVDDNDPNSMARKETEEIIRPYIDNMKVIYIQHEYNKNGSAARNTGWRHSKGKYITFLDDDDEIAATKIEKQVDCLDKLDESWGLCYTGYKILMENGRKQISSEKRSGNCYIYALMRTLYMGSGSNILLRKSVVDEIGGYDESFIRNQDVEFLARALENYKLAYVDEILLTIHQEGTRVVRSFEQLDGYTKHYIEKFKNRINKLKPKEFEKVNSVISLERCRVAFYKKEYKIGLKILRDNKVKIKYIIKYIFYLMKRLITYKSYGFSGD